MSIKIKYCGRFHFSNFKIHTNSCAYVMLHNLCIALITRVSCMIFAFYLRFKFSPGYIIDKTMEFMTLHSNPNSHIIKWHKLFHQHEITHKHSNGLIGHRITEITALMITNTTQTFHQYYLINADDVGDTIKVESHCICVEYRWPQSFQAKLETTLFQAFDVCVFAY